MSLDLDHYLTKDGMLSKDEIRDLMHWVSATEYRLLTTDWLDNGEPTVGLPHTGVFMPLPYPVVTQAFMQLTCRWEDSGYRYIWEPDKALIRQLLAEGMMTPYPEPLIEDPSRFDAVNVTLKLMGIKNLMLRFKPYRVARNHMEARRAAENPRILVNSRPYQLKNYGNTVKAFSTIDSVETYVSEINL